MLFCATSSLSALNFLASSGTGEEKKKIERDLERGGGVDAERGGRNIMIRLVYAIQKIEALKREI